MAVLYHVKFERSGETRELFIDPGCIAKEDFAWLKQAFSLRVAAECEASLLTKQSKRQYILVKSLRSPLLSAPRTPSLLCASSRTAHRKGGGSGIRERQRPTAPQPRLPTAGTDHDRAPVESLTHRITPPAQRPSHPITTLHSLGPPPHEARLRPYNADQEPTVVPMCPRLAPEGRYRSLVHGWPRFVTDLLILAGPDRELCS
ncbi:hypothetical protein NDU88_003889 [Pleurodeles waltl]|uniref:Uncharacterized protein n=1 Tax=Pleurodeles waltl TaxID=8319 RepID=A0AAV7L0B5_PLEWA|nr:hypothetical protein NDU88_003889 [Pleurodeles waltl]